MQWLDQLDICILRHPVQQLGFQMQAAFTKMIRGTQKHRSYKDINKICFKSKLCTQLTKVKEISSQVFKTAKYPLMTYKWNVPLFFVLQFLC